MTAAPLKWRSVGRCVSSGAIAIHSLRCRNLPSLDPWARDRRDRPEHVAVRPGVIGLGFQSDAS